MKFIKKYQKIYVIFTMILMFTGCTPQQFLGVNSSKGASSGFSFAGLHSRETAMDIYRRSSYSAVGAFQGMGIRNVVEGDSNKGFYRNLAYGREAYIHLIFTKPGKNALLRQIVVDWREGAHFFEAGIFDQQAVNNHYNYVARQLTKKYGKHIRKGLWKPNRSTSIRLKKTLVGVKLTFTDNLSTNKRTKKNTSRRNSTTGQNNLNNILSTAIKVGSLLYK